MQLLQQLLSCCSCRTSEKVRGPQASPTTLSFLLVRYIQECCRHSGVQEHTYLDWQAQSVCCVQEQLLCLLQHVLDVLLLPSLHAGRLPFVVRHKLQLLGGGAQPQQVVALTPHDVKPADHMFVTTCLVCTVFAIAAGATLVLQQSETELHIRQKPPCCEMRVRPVCNEIQHPTTCLQSNVHEQLREL